MPALAVSAVDFFPSASDNKAHGDSDNDGKGEELILTSHFVFLIYRSLFISPVNPFRFRKTDHLLLGRISIQ